MTVTIGLALAVVVGIRYCRLAAFSAFQGYGFNLSSESSEVARRDGLLVATVQVEPKSFSFLDQNIKFVDAWVEYSSNTHYRYMLFPTRTRTSKGYSLCFRLSENNFTSGNNLDVLEERKVDTLSCAILGAKIGQYEFFFRLKNGVYCADLGSVSNSLTVNVSARASGIPQGDSRFVFTLFDEAKSSNAASDDLPR